MSQFQAPDGGGAGRKLAQFATHLLIADVPLEVRELAKQHILDAVGCGIAAASSSLTLNALRYLAIEHASGPCPVLATPATFGPAAAAFGNALAMNALDFDDGFEIAGRGMGHPGASLVAAALSGVWGARIDGATFLAGVIAAYEINNRVVMSIQPSMARFRKVYGVGQHQSIGSAAAFGRLAGLDPEAMENVFEIAATLANVPSLRKYNWGNRPLVSLKDFVAPAAETGVRAVQLHLNGFIGSANVFEGDGGYWRMAGSDRFAQDQLVDGFGEKWTLRHNSIKPYPACRWIHTALEGLQTLLDEQALGPEDIEEIVVHCSSAIASDFLDFAPANMIDAQFSLPFTMAALARRVPLSRWYDDEVMADPSLKQFGRKVRARVDPTIDAIVRKTRAPAARVCVRAHGREFSSPILRLPLGSGERPLSPQSIIAKFHANAGKVIGLRPAEHLAKRLLSLEEESCVASMLRESIPRIEAAAVMD